MLVDHQELFWTVVGVCICVGGVGFACIVVGSFRKNAIQPHADSDSGDGEIISYSRAPIPNQDVTN